jgi:uncharacterized protein YdaU (DUF1376 family)
MIEDGAYNRLLRLCWMTPGCTIPADHEWIMRRARARTDDERAAVLAVLGEFFTTDNGRVRNNRLHREAMLAEASHSKRVDAGRKGGRSAKALKPNEIASSNVKAKPKQPEPEPYKTLEADASNGAGAPTTIEVSVTSAAVWAAGKPYLASRGVENPGAMIGRWLKSHSPLALLGAIEAAQKSGTQDPVPYIIEALKEKPHGRASKSQERLNAFIAGARGTP